MRRHIRYDVRIRPWLREIKRIQQNAGHGGLELRYCGLDLLVDG